MAQSKRRQAEAPNSAGDNTAAPNVVPIRIDSSADPLDSFKPESARGAKVVPAPPAPSPRPASPTPAPPPAALKAAPAASVAVAVERPAPAGRGLKALGAIAACIALGAVAANLVYLRDLRGLIQPAQSAPVMGRAILNTRPAGAAVVVDGVSRGVTPLELELSAGTHNVLFQSGTSERRIELKVEAGTRVSENVDMPAAVAAVGALEITSDPPGARVSVDGTAAGVTPLTLRNVTPARHLIAVAQGSSTVNRTVEVAAGATSSVFVALGQQASASAGSFAVDSPLDLRIMENGQLLGVANAAPVVLAAGRHQFDLVNEAVEFRISRTVTVEPGKTARLSVPAPNGRLSVNATPWAEVFVDGRSIGVTPLGEVSVPVGSREVVWRHPQLGEKRRTIVVGAQSPTRVSMDMR